MEALHVAERGQRLGGHRAAVAPPSTEHQLDPLGARDPRHERLERSVVQQAAPVDHQHPRRERGHVLHVVRREQHRRAVPLAVLDEEPADRVLGGHVEPQGRLVEEQERRAMQQRRYQLALHALAERELTHRLLEHVAQLEQGDQLGQPLPVISRRDVVDRAVQQERLLGREVPYQLLPVTEHERDASLERGAAGPGHEPRRLDSPAGGVQEPREHLDRRGLARAVRAQERDDLAGDRKSTRLNSSHGYISYAVFCLKKKKKKKIDTNKYYVKIITVFVN